MNKFLDETKIIKKNGNNNSQDILVNQNELDNMLQENEISPWPKLNSELEQELTDLANAKANTDIDVNMSANGQQTTINRSKKKRTTKQQIKEQQVASQKEKDDVYLKVLTDMLEKITYQLVDREVNIKVYQAMMKETGNNESRKRYLQLVNNCNNDIRELKIKIDIIKDLISKEG